MAETQLAVASAVILPDPVEESVSPSLSTKRRQFSFEEGGAKRPRLSQSSDHDAEDRGSKSPFGHNQPSDRRKNGQLEERKRGQRLFGALLGTLSQSSSSTAQKRRLDIEKKQQAKLKLQAEEYDEKKKQRLDALMDVRRREQKKYDKQSMQIRHSNLLAKAQFLRTRSEPVLYYKPWELLPGDDIKIKAQVEEAERTIEREIAQFEEENPESNQQVPDADNNDPGSKTDEVPASETVGLANDVPEPFPTTHGDTDKPPSPTPDAPLQSVELSDTSKDQGDDGGDIVLEGDEDTVIY